MNTPKKRNEKLQDCILKGERSKWFKWYNDREPFQSWDKFKTTTIEKYGITQVRRPCKQLMDLKQIGSIAEYYK